MNRRSEQSDLEKSIGLLVEQFGVQRVRSALTKYAVSGEKASSVDGVNRRGQSRGNVTLEIARLRETDPEKCELLADFHSRLKDGSVLKEPQDIRHFSQLVGLRGIVGKSRKDLIPKLLRALIHRPKEKLRGEIQSADSISERQRQQGYSIIADKLLSGVR